MTPAVIWHPNRGQPPVFYPLSDEDPCPPNLIHKDAAQTARVFVRFRNGREAKGTLPIFGRPPTRWTLQRDPYDITHWRPA